MGDEDDCIEYLPTHHLSAASAGGLRLRHVTEDLIKRSAEMAKQLRSSNSLSTGLEGATVKSSVMAVVNDTQRILHSIRDSQTES
ncbi:hypothetical protein RvY_16890 [Ramazzottius varieornatus]|uniref:Uncharacterized protein n=1 Tax=Ramazzottius varieornatus TaxID=947166 RepID=A0A1D1W7C6_RAMVA|nr:hypothetical protein RvY_16890 [Ramazzottius varieornatus]